MALKIGTSRFKWVVIGVFISAHMTFLPFGVWKDLGHILKSYFQGKSYTEAKFALIIQVALAILNGYSKRL